MRYFDLHCDTVTECAEKGCGLSSNGLHVSLDRADVFERYAQFFAVWIPDSLRGDDAWARYQRVRGVFVREMEKNASRIRACANSDDLSKAFCDGKKAALLSVEGGAAIGGKIDRLAALASDGVRMMTLTWNGRNEIGDGCMTKDAGGLTDFGKEVVRSMAPLHMIVDVSHLSERGFWDVAEQTQAPFVASHSDAAAVEGHPRNLSDSMICEIASRHGLIGLNLYPPFLAGREKAPLDAVLAHVDQICEAGGASVLAVGADFDGASMPDGIGSIGDMTHLYDMLVKRYQKSTADAIFFDHAAKFVSGALTDAPGWNTITVGT